jgi:micrococcal nuclease
MPYEYKEAEVQQRIKAKLTRVIDGDTVEITSKDHKVFIVRLWNIDCPEITQDFGKEAKQFLEDKVLDLDIDFELVSVGKYNRNVGKIFVTKSNNTRVDIATALLASGFAHATTQNLRDPYVMFEARGRRSKIGLWSDENHIIPSDFRNKITLKEKPLEKPPENSVEQERGFAAKNLISYPEELKKPYMKKKSKNKSLFD